MRSPSFGKRPFLELVLCAATWGALGACSGDRSGRDASRQERELVVFAAASLREAFDALGQELERAHPGLRVRTSYAGSQVLRAQIEQGAAADVIAAAAAEELAPLLAQQRIAAPQVFAHNELVIAKPRGAAAPDSLRALPDVARIVIGNEQVPVGRYARSMLARADAAYGADFSTRVLRSVVSQEPNTRQVLARVGLREADAAVVYRTDALAAARRVDTVAIPAELNERAQYVIAALRSSEQAELAAAFVALATAPQGQAVLQRFGFLPASDSPGKPGAASSGTAPVRGTAPALRGGAEIEHRGAAR